MFAYTKNLTVFLDSIHVHWYRYIIKEHIPFSYFKECFFNSICVLQVNDMCKPSLRIFNFADSNIYSEMNQVDTGKINFLQAFLHEILLHLDS